MVYATKRGMERRKSPPPLLEVQKEIVAEIEGYQKNIEEYRCKIEEEEQKIEQAINCVWG